MHETRNPRAEVSLSSDSNDVQALLQEENERLRRRVAELEVPARRFRALVDSGVLSVQMYRLDGQTIEVNAAWAQLWGIPAEIGLGYNILGDAQLREHGILPAIEAVFREDRAANLPAIRYDPEKTEGIHVGRSRWVASVMAPVHDEAGMCEVVQLHLPVGELKESEEELRWAGSHG